MWVVEHEKVGGNSMTRAVRGRDRAWRPYWVVCYGPFEQVNLVMEGLILANSPTDAATKNYNGMK